MDFCSLEFEGTQVSDTASGNPPKSTAPKLSNEEYDSASKIRDHVESELRWKFSLFAIYLGLTVGGAALGAYVTVTTSAKDFLDMARDSIGEANTELRKDRENYLAQMSVWEAEGSKANMQFLQYEAEADNQKKQNEAEQAKFDAKMAELGDRLVGYESKINSLQIVANTAAETAAKAVSIVNRSGGLTLS